MKKHLFTHADVAALRGTYGFHLSSDGKLFMKRDTNNGTRNYPMKQVFILRAPSLRIRCFADAMVQGIRGGVEPVELMARIHNYGLRNHRHIIEKSPSIHYMTQVLIKEHQGQPLTVTEQAHVVLSQLG